MVLDSISAVRDALHETVDPAYAKKQLHRVPSAPAVKRREFVADYCKDKVVLHLGASGVMHDMLLKTVKTMYGVDRVADPARHIEAADLDAYEAHLPVHADVDIIVAGEVLEHLSNPGWLLARLRTLYPAPTKLLVTVPNAFCNTCDGSLKKGIENVNIEHVAWYSYTTLHTLLSRHGWAPQEFCWYNGQPYFAEGLIMLAE